MCCVRVSLIIFNAITLLAGLATVGIGLWLIFQEVSHGGNEASIVVSAGTPDKFILSNGDLKLISILLLSIGALVTFVSVIGCTGACVKSRCLLMSYLLTVVLILTLQLLVAICAFLYREPIAAALHDELMTNLKNEYEMSPDNGNSVKRSWDMMQNQFQCCGVDNYADWYDAKAWPGKNYVPESCCMDANATAVYGGCGRTDNPGMWFKQGCLDKIKAAILEQLHILASVVITLVFLQLYGIIASILLFFHAKAPKPKSPQYKAYLYERARM